MRPNYITTEHPEYGINSHRAQSCAPTSAVIYGKPKAVTGEISKIIDLSVDSGLVVIEGEIISKETRDLKSGKVLISMNIFDGTSTITCKVFAKDQNSAKEILDKINKAKGVRVSGDAQFDPFSKELGIICKAIVETAGTVKEKRTDTAENKRVELHLHTQMSQMDGISSATDLIKTATSWGMKAIAITDHGVVQAFPEAKKAAKDMDIKVIYGVEAYIVPDKSSIVFGHSKESLDTEYCVLDIETTGLSYRTEKITEIAAVKIKNGEIIDKFACFVNPERPIPARITEITNITDDMVKNAETIEQIMPKFLRFIGETTLVAHNANFDLGFLRYNAEKIGLAINNVYIDTVALAKGLFPNFSKYKLGIIAENLKIEVEVAHRALDDVMTLIKIFNIMIEKLREKEVVKISEIEGTLDKNIDFKKMETYHAVIIAKTQEGLKNLYKLISFSHLNYFYKKPRIPKSLYLKHSNGLIISSGCEVGELYSAILSRKDG